jgi:hypothetical protein
MESAGRGEADMIEFRGELRPVEDLTLAELYEWIREQRRRAAAIEEEIRQRVEEELGGYG